MEAGIIIVGAGPTGLVLACDLARRGVPYRLVERSKSAAIGSRGKGVQPRSLEIFDDLGIADQLIAAGRFDMPMLLHGATEAQVLESSPFPREGARHWSSLLTPQWQVEAILRARLADLGGRVSWGCEVVGIEQADDRVIACVRADGRDERVEGRWLVGCDGGQSSVRKCVGIPFVGETFEHIRMWLGDVTLEGLDRNHWHLWRDGDGFLALCPLPGTDQFQFQAQIAAEERREPALELFDDMMRQRTGRGDIHLSGARWLSSWRANVRLVERFRAGRVLLAGDAAHVHSPAGAQGMNTGIQDAYNLGWKLAAVLGGAEESLVDTYQEERLPVARGVLDLSTELTSTAFSPDRHRDERTLQLGLGYRASSLSVNPKAAGTGVRAGDRAPNATGLRGSDGVSRCLFDLLRGVHATVLVFDSDAPPALAATVKAFGRTARLVRITSTEQSAAADCWHDEQGSAWRLYDPVPGAVFVVRPDGYIGLHGSVVDLAELDGYLRRIVPSCTDAATDVTIDLALTEQQPGRFHNERAPVGAADPMVTGRSHGTQRVDIEDQQ